MTMAWDAAAYDTQHGYIWKHGAGVVDLLNAQPGERILDLGCGTGHLTAQIDAAGAEVIGIDNDPGMIELARQHYPSLRFEVADGSNFRLDQRFDAVFSNAAIHWMRYPAGVVASVRGALRPGGRFVAEFGGKGNVAAITSALYAAMRPYHPSPESLNPWYFPSVGEYAALLENSDFEVNLAMLFDRPTLVEGGEAGMRSWLGVFAKDFLAAVPPEAHPAIIADVEERLRPALLHDGVWVADYRRLRIVAHLTGE
ncbi:MAG: class I SAM-dependent methyltransferase [Anaerolineae bacterium]